jgi:hypothetical protein
LYAQIHGFLLGVPIDGVAFTASSLVILPSYQFLLQMLERYFFRLIFFLLLEMVFLKHMLPLVLLLLSWSRFGASATELLVQELTLLV